MSKKYKFLISSYHTVYEDSFTEGEGIRVADWELGGERAIIAECPIDAIAEYYRNTLCYAPFDPSRVEIDEHRVYDGRIVKNVNRYHGDHCFEPVSLDSEDYTQFKEGKKVLYSEQITVYVKELIYVDLERAYKVKKQNNA